MNQPEVFKTIKQPEGSRFCAAAVAAMATGKTLGHVLKNATMTPSRGAAHRLFMRTRHLIQYLAENGVIYGLVLHDLPDMDGYETLEISYCQACPAILTVPS